MGRHFMGKYLMGKHLMGKHLMGKHLMGKHLMGKHLMGRHLIGRHLISKHSMGIVNGDAPESFRGQSVVEKELVLLTMRRYLLLSIYSCSRICSCSGHLSAAIC